MQSNQIFTLNTLKAMTKDLRNQGRIIGLAHGAFDLFHVSHLDLLKKASKKCDFLLVGVDSNRNIAKYKSHKRPIIPEDERLKIVAELNCVDGAFINSTLIDDGAYIQLYKDLKVDYLFTGKIFDFKDRLEYRASKIGAIYLQIDTKQIPSTTYIVNEIISKQTKTGA